MENTEKKSYEAENEETEVQELQDENLEDVAGGEIEPATTNYGCNCDCDPR